jgi:Zn-dependent peptidase ImmA (M78 family)
MRFSLAHELGHAIMHRIPTDDIEDEANAFAGELLLPERQFRRILVGQTVTLEWLARQKAYWRTSMAFLLYRAGAVGALTRHQSEYLWKKLSALGWRTREPQETEFAYEQPSAFPRLIRLHSDDMHYDLETLTRLLSMGTSDLQRFYGAYLGRGRTGLYVVK